MSCFCRSILNFFLLSQKAGNLTSLVLSVGRSAPSSSAVSGGGLSMLSITTHPIMMATKIMAIFLMDTLWVMYCFSDHDAVVAVTKGSFNRRQEKVGGIRI